jgi:hypothetical protein
MKTISIGLAPARCLRRAPERSALALLDAALAVAENALYAEHPSLDDALDETSPLIASTLVTALMLVRRIDEIRRLLAFYELALRNALGEHEPDFDCDIPF